MALLSNDQRSHPASPTNPPAHQVVYRQIRELVLYGELVPGQAITIQGLAGLIGSGITPVREAIRRLTAEGALIATDNRRVSVPELSAKLLEELSFARLSIEPHLAKLAAQRITPAQIDALEQIDLLLDEAIEGGDVHGYLHLNYRFHRTLYSHSDTEILLAMADSLWLRAGPSLRVICGRYGTLNLPDMHEEAVAAMRENDPDAVARAIHQDIEQGHHQIARALVEG